MKRHIRILILSLAAVLAAVLLEKAFPVAPGLFVGTLELLLESATLFVFVRSLRRSRWDRWQGFFMTSSLVFLFSADLFYIYFYYWRKIGRPTEAVSLLTSLPYALSFVCLSGFFWTSIVGNLRSFLRSPIALLPVLIITPIAARLALPLFSHQSPQILFRIVESCSLFGSYSVFIVALFIFLASREVFWVLLASGPLIFLLSDWAIKVEKFSGHDIKFVDYEFLWAFGTSLFCITLLLEIPDKTRHEGFEFRSIALSSRLTALLISFASILLVALSQTELALVKFITVSAALGIVGSGLLAQLHLDQLNMFSSALDALLSGGPTKVPASRSWSPELEKSLNAVLQTKLDELRRSEQANARMLLASQVVHDIRSPLAALNVAIATSDQLPEDSRVIVRSAVSRIRDIANNLLLAERGAGAPAASSAAAAEPPGVHLLSGLVQSLVSEKRFQYRTLIGIEIEAELHPDTYGLFAELQSVEFKRLLSNLVDNAVQALGAAGKVAINLARDGESVLVSVADNGPGIPAHLLPRLGQRGVTHGKPGGSGLGLYHARTTLERWGGQFRVRSSAATGTTIELSLRRAPAPSWFVERVALSPGLTVLILDDDKAIHATWDRLLSGHSSLGLAVHHFTEAALLSAWLREKRPSLFLGLVDYELLRQSISGLDLIEQEGIAASSILVTSRFEEPAVLTRCARLGLRMIPKDLVGLVPLVAPVTVPTPEAPKKALRVLVVDDDDMIHAIWRRVRTRLGVDEVITYASIEACEAAGVDYAAFDLCFLDMKIPESKVSITDALRLLKQRGARRVIIATGMPLDAYEQRLRDEGADGFAPEKVPLEIKSFLANA